MTTDIVIGILGKKGSGKTTLADNLVAVAQENPKFYIGRYSFASTIKKLAILRQINSENAKHAFHYAVANIVPDTSYDVIYSAVKQSFEYPCEDVEKPREWLQYVGTEIFRNQVDDDFWIKAAISEIEEAYKLDFAFPERTHNIFIFDDVRFPNELAWVTRQKNHLTMYLNRTDMDHTDEHASENALTPADLEVMDFVSPVPANTPFDLVKSLRYGLSGKFGIEL